MTLKSTPKQFLSALEEADTDAIRAMVADGYDIGAPVRLATYNGMTPLMLAAQWGNAGLCAVLVELGADPHAVSHGPLEITALANAAYAGRENVCRFLLEKAPPQAHIIKAIAFARSGRNYAPSALEQRFRGVLNCLLWARDGITLPGSVTNLLAGEHPDVDSDEAPARRAPRAH